MKTNETLFILNKEKYLYIRPQIINLMLNYV